VIPDLISFGFLDECEDFKTRNGPFIERFPRLKTAIELSDASVSLEGLHQQTIMLLCRLAREDFMEILLLAANGYGVGAEKLLRGLYEKVVTAYYLIDHPEKARDFTDFGLINIHRVVRDSAELLGSIISNEMAARAKATWDRYRREGRSTRHWSGVPFRQMAEGIAEVRHFLLVAYTEPSLKLHPSPQAMIDRLDFPGGGTIVFDGKAQRGDADSALTWAHALFLHALAIQAAVFRLTDLAEAVKVCFSDWDSAWPAAASSSQASR
jgi:hypothetical protein